MRLTIERLRTLVLLAGALLVIALGVFLGVGRFRNRFNRKDIPHKLGLNIQEEANGFVYSHEVRGHTLYKIRASKQVQLKQNGKVMLQLHDVMIELYAEDGSRVDRIQGNEFDYDPNSGIAKALGPVEITLMKPTQGPADTQKAAHDQMGDQKNKSLASASHAESSGEIEVKTSGLTFDRNSGEASTDQRVEFTLTQGTGSAIGANYDAHEGQLVLGHAVELNVERGTDPVKLNAQHAVFKRDDRVCELTAATMHFRADQASAENAKIFFRDDGSAERLDASREFVLLTSTGGKLAAPTGTLNFDEHNQPLHGHLQGGVTMDSEHKGRKVHGTSPEMELEFAGQGMLRRAHLERGVEIVSDDNAAGTNGMVHAHRTWTSPVVDVAFKSTGKNRVEPASIHGIGGVTIMASSQHGNGPVVPEKMMAEDVTGVFGANGTLTTMTGRGHTSIAETTATGTQQTTSGDVLIAHLGPAQEASGKNATGKNATGGGMQIDSATVDGNVVVTQQAPAKGGTAPSILRATGGHADYEGIGEWLHLTKGPRVSDGALEMSADKLNVSQGTGDAFAQGNVKATWMGREEQDVGAKSSPAAKGSGGAEFGAQGPTHAVAQEAQLQRSGMATFKGNARLWQLGNSVTAPVIVLDRTKQTMAAQTMNAKTPVEVVLVSAATVVPGRQGATKQGPSVIRIHGGDLKYSSAERKAVMRSGAPGRVTATTADATTMSNEVELLLLPPGNHAGRDGGAAQVDRMTSTGNVEISSGGRHGTGAKLVYQGDTGEYVLTGTAAAPPRLTDPVRGVVTGPALIFNSRDDSVRVDGEGRRTTTVTTAPK